MWWHPKIWNGISNFPHIMENIYCPNQLVSGCGLNSTSWHICSIAAVIEDWLIPYMIWYGCESSDPILNTATAFKADSRFAPSQWESALLVMTSLIGSTQPRISPFIKTDQLNLWIKDEMDSNFIKAGPGFYPVSLVKWPRTSPEI